MSSPVEFHEQQSPYPAPSAPGPSIGNSNPNTHSEPRKPVPSHGAVEDVPVTQPNNPDGVGRRSSSGETYVGQRSVHRPNSFDEKRPATATTADRPKTSSKAEDHRLEDDLELLKAERMASRTSGQPENIYEQRVKPHIGAVDADTSSISSGHPWRPVPQETNKFAIMVKKVNL